MITLLNLALWIGVVLAATGLLYVIYLLVDGLITSFQSRVTTKSELPPLIVHRPVTSLHAPARKGFERQTPVDEALRQFDRQHCLDVLTSHERRRQHLAAVATTTGRRKA